MACTMNVPSMTARSTISRLWRHPALIALAAALLIIVAAFVPALWQAVRGLTTPDGLATRAAPWEADVTAGGALRALGLRIPGATLHDAQALWGEQLQVAVMVPRDGPASLEASVENARPGGIQGRVLLTASASVSDLQRWIRHPAKDEVAGPTTRRITLDLLSLGEALRTPINAIGFIPSTQLEADVVRHRFGEPAEVLEASGGVQHWLYPVRGLALMIDPKGRELLQFVPPAQFESRLRAPLLDVLKDQAREQAATRP